jgi:hypothetical protein
VPCDGHDDLCEDFEDEKCDLGTSLSFIVLIVCGLLIVISAVGEALVFHQKQTNFGTEEENLEMKKIVPVQKNVSFEDFKTVKKLLSQVSVRYNIT